MDELKLLIEMVASLPSMALWVLVGFFAYKVVVIGSIFGVIRLGIIKFHDWLTKRLIPPAPPIPHPVPMTLGVKPIDETTAAALNAQLIRLTKRYSHFHMDSVIELKKAIDHIEAEQKKG